MVSVTADSYRLREVQTVTHIAVLLTGICGVIYSVSAGAKPIYTQNALDNEPWKGCRIVEHSMGQEIRWLQIHTGSTCRPVKDQELSKIAITVLCKDRGYFVYFLDAPSCETFHIIKDNEHINFEDLVSRDIADKKYYVSLMNECILETDIDLSTDDANLRDRYDYCQCVGRALTEEGASQRDGCFNVDAISSRCKTEAKVASAPTLRLVFSRADKKPNSSEKKKTYNLQRGQTFSSAKLMLSQFHSNFEEGYGSVALTFSSPVLTAYPGTPIKCEINFVNGRLTHCRNCNGEVLKCP